MIRIILLICYSVTIISCNDAVEKKQNKPTEEKKAASFFPVTNYIQGQVAEIESKGINPMKINTSGNKSDSSWLKVEEFNNAFKEFVTPVIDSISHVQFFTESNFADQSLDTYTFTYAPKGVLPDSILLQRWDVHIDPATNTVKRIFIVKRTPDNKELQLTWQSGKWCKIVSIKTDKSGKQSVEYEQTIKWNFD
ncbi:MAG TPA: hypothetical protein VLR49_06540 [Ferruginibacter sp.]|nr:hypothetical protein [Ferruginibacter sp.]